MDMSQFQREAYHAVLRAVALGQMGWDTEDTLAKLRITLAISDDMHKELRDRVKGDAEINCLKNGQLYSRGSMPQQYMHGSQGTGQGMGGHRGHRAPPNNTQLASRHSVTRGDRNYIAQTQGLMAPVPGGARSGMGGAQRGTPLSMQDRQGSHLSMTSMPQGAVAGAPLNKPLNPRAGMPRTVPPMRDVKPESMMARQSFVSGSKASKPKSSSSQMKEGALPPEIDLAKSDLVGLKVRRWLTKGTNYPQGWYDGIIAHVRDLPSGRACNIVYDLDQPHMSWDLDYHFRQNKAGKEWVIFNERVNREWSRIQPPTPAGRKAAAAGGKKRKPSGIVNAVAPGSGTLASFGSAALPSAPLGSMSLELNRIDMGRLEAADGSKAPYDSATFTAAVEHFDKHGNDRPLQEMLAHIRKKRGLIITAVAQLELAAAAEKHDSATVLTDLNRSLTDVRHRINAIQQEIGAH